MPIPVQKLPSLEEAFNGTLFGTAVPGPKTDEKTVVMVDPKELIEIEDQPFHPYPPDRLAELAEDIKQNGQINPCTVRLIDGKNFILAGRNRKKACELAGIKVACIFIECDDATANLILVNSNLNQRQKLLPSELAFAYKLQKESYEAKGQKKSTAAVAEQNAENVKKIQRYIKLTELSPDLLKMVDEDRLPIMVGYELSYLCPGNMNCISSYLSSHPEQKVSVEQSQVLRDENAVFSDNWLNVFFHHPEFYKHKEEKPANNRQVETFKHVAPALAPSMSAQPAKPTEEPAIPFSEGSDLPEEGEDEEPLPPTQVKETPNVEQADSSPYQVSEPDNSKEKSEQQIQTTDAKSTDFQDALNKLNGIYLQTGNANVLKEPYRLSLQALEKQIAKPLIKVTRFSYKCPTCGTLYGLSSSRFGPDTEYCSHCGQLTSGWRKECK